MQMEWRQPLGHKTFVFKCKPVVVTHLSHCISTGLSLSLLTFPSFAAFALRTPHETPKPQVKADTAV